MNAPPTIFIASGQRGSMRTPLLVATLSTSSLRAARLISFPFRSATQSRKSNSTQHCCSFLQNRSCNSATGASGRRTGRQKERKIKRNVRYHGQRIRKKKGDEAPPSLFLKSPLCLFGRESFDKVKKRAAAYILYGLDLLSKVMREREQTITLQTHLYTPTYRQRLASVHTHMSIHKTFFLLRGLCCVSALLPVRFVAQTCSSQ